MRVTTKAVFDIATLLLLEWNGYEYSGPLELCGGGPSQQQIDAANATAANDTAQTQIAQQYNQRQTDAYNKILPYATSRLSNGLPFYGNLTDYSGGNAATAYNPVRAATLRSLAGFGSALPSGYKNAALTDVNLGEAQNFDSGLESDEMANEQAKANAAGLLVGQQQINNPITAYGSANQGNNSIMQAPLRSPSLGGLIGGLGGGLLNAAGTLGAAGAF